MRWPSSTSAPSTTAWRHRWPPRGSDRAHPGLRGLRVRLHQDAPGPFPLRDRARVRVGLSARAPAEAADRPSGQLGDALDTVPAVASGSLSREQLVDVVVRLFASSFIIPEPDDRALVQSVNGMLLPPAPR
jgi:hypothetical protein